MKLGPLTSSYENICDFSRDVLKFVKLGHRKTMCWDMVVEECSFCSVLLMVAFRKVGIYNEKIDFRDIRLTDPINRL